MVSRSIYLVILLGWLALGIALCLSNWHLQVARVRLAGLRLGDGVVLNLPTAAPSSHLGASGLAGRTDGRSLEQLVESWPNVARAGYT